MAEIEVDDAKIKALGTDIKVLGNNLDGPIEGLDFTIKAGNFFDADEFEEIVHERRNDFRSNLEQTQLVLAGFETGLHETASIYAGTDKDNEVKVDALDVLVENTNSNLPGFDEYEPEKEKEN